MGFPLDDAWIHQTYARNLVNFGEWAFIPGIISGGSTSPLWTLMIAIGYLFRLQHLFWAYCLGVMILLGIAVYGQRLFDHFSGHRHRFPVAGIFLILEWHLIWAAVSGMETLLSGLIILATFVYLVQSSRPGWLLGSLVGISIWCRPDGVLLFAPVIGCFILSRENTLQKVHRLKNFAIGITVCVVPYLIFNYLTQRSILPGTFYAKQAEYASQSTVPIFLRFVEQLSLPLVGAGVLLLPGAIYLFYRALMARNWNVVLIYAWLLGFAGLYAWRLPVSYQHGRYLIPVMPVYFTLGLAGLRLIQQRLGEEGIWRRIVIKSWGISVGMVLLGFVFLGARSYAVDVAIIETEMVRTAKWLSVNTRPGDVLAVHDIGAIGYYVNSPIIDLAGLVSPEVIPFIRDEGRIKEYLDQKNVKYLVTFPGWYPDLVRNLQPVYKSGGDFAEKAGGENMVVYLWQN